MRILKIWVTILMIGCVSKVTYFPASYKSSEIEILTSPPAKPYKVLGIIQVEGNEWMNKEDFLRLLRNKASQIGADALIEVEFKKGGEKLEKAKLGHYAEGRLVWDLPKRKINKLFGGIVLKAKAIKYVKDLKEGGE
ncbi:MAG: hypothetical protein B6D55_02550 [Candidatus Omnitrophica bacterium 4484_70.2]|nr:MAG: hypothetical protein B6D55_02550 [Candidatus Omnitrophica bacterium 4484_70.2]